jgi:23S rRNA pseudouridine2605 synthase
MIRVQKFLADAGVASRRASERLVADGQVTVNGEVVRTPGFKVDPSADIVTVGGKPVRPRRKIYVALHKPRGYLCTRRDPQDRRVVHDLLPDEWSHLFTVGRLDRDTEGLLLLTNDGAFSLQLSHPRYGVRKHYEAEVEGKVTLEEAGQLTQGIHDDGEFLKAEAVRIIKANNTHSRLELELTEGRYREVRRLLQSIGHPVTLLRRTQVGSLRLGELPPGRWRQLSATEVKSLLPPRC